MHDVVQRSAELRDDHDQESTPGQRRIIRLTALLGRPVSVAVIAMLVVVWIGGNVAVQWLGGKPLDPPPFPWLEGVVSLGALLITLLILVAQRREDELSRRRDALTLQLSSLSEMKAAKIIQLLEELRRDSAALPDRRDPEAEEMAQGADPKAVFAAIKAKDEARIESGADAT